MKSIVALLVVAVGCSSSDNPPVVNVAPSVSVMAPMGDLEVRTGALVRLEYTDDDPDDSAATDLLADVDGDLSTTGDQYVIASGRPEQDGALQALDWDTTGVAAGSYSVHAVTSDAVNPSATAASVGRVTVYDPGNAIELLGDGGHIAFPQALIGDRATFTFECWIKPTWPPVAGAPNPSRNNIYGETSGLSGVRHEIQILSEDPTIPGHDLGALTCAYWTSPDVVEVFTQPLHEGQWQHVAVVVDAGLMRLYVNGALHDQGNAQAYAGPTPDVFRIGNAFDRNYGRFVIDDVRVSSTARYAANFEPRVVLATDPDTLSLWHFDEPGGTAVVDATGNAPDATLSATAARVPADRYAVAGLFDDFEDGIIDPALWEVFQPFPSSSATESGGTLNLSLRPYVATYDEWRPDANVPVVVEFDWTPASSISHLNLLTRCDATWAGSFAEAATGVGVNFSVEAGSVWGYDTAGGSVTGMEFGTLPFTFVPGTTYRIRLMDDGASLRLFIDDMTTPFAVGATTQAFAVNRVVFYSRELGSGAEQFDNFRISGVRLKR